MGNKGSKRGTEYAWREQLEGGYPLIASYFSNIDVSTVNTETTLLKLLPNGDVALMVKFDGEMAFEQRSGYGKWERKDMGLVVLTRTVVTEMYLPEPLRPEVVQLTVDPKTGFLAIVTHEEAPRSGFIGMVHSNTISPAFVMMILQRECHRCGGFACHADPTRFCFHIL